MVNISSVDGCYVLHPYFGQCIASPPPVIPIMVNISSIGDCDVIIQRYSSNVAPVMVNLSSIGGCNVILQQRVSLSSLILSILQKSHPVPSRIEIPENAGAWDREPCLCKSMLYFNYQSHQGITRVTSVKYFSSSNGTQPNQTMSNQVSAPTQLIALYKLEMYISDSWTMQVFILNESYLDKYMNSFHWPGVLAQLSEGEVKGGGTGEGWRWNIQELVQEVSLLRRLPGKQHPVFQAVPKPANTVMYGGDCRDCRQHHEPTLGLQQVLFSWPPLWPCDYKFIEKYNLVIMNLLRNTTGIWLQSTSARSWCWNSI